MINRKSHLFRVRQAILKGDDTQTRICITNALQEIGGDLVDLVGQYPKDDLPFVVAAMKSVAASFEGMLPDSAKRIVAGLVDASTTVIIQKNGGASDE